MSYATKRVAAFIVFAFNSKRMSTATLGGILLLASQFNHHD